MIGYGAGLDCLQQIMCPWHTLCGQLRHTLERYICSAVALLLVTPVLLTGYLSPPPPNPSHPAADFVVSCALELHCALRKAAGAWQQRAKWLAMRCGLHAVRASVVLLAVAAGKRMAARFGGWE